MTKKISASPSTTLLVWVGAFIAGIAAPAVFFPAIMIEWARPTAVGTFVLALVAIIIVKDKKIRLISVAGFLFIAGAARYLSAADQAIDPLSYFPALIGAKDWLVAAVGRMLVEPQAGLMNGLLVGGGARSSELHAVFIATGTAHVMALSGWNLTVINRWLDKLLIVLRFRKKARWFLTAAAIIAFVIVAGAGASLVRAAIMAMLVTVASASGRRSAPARAVVYAAAVMLLASPRIIATDIGFLLSVSATLGMIYLAPFFGVFAKYLPDRFDLPGIVAGTLGATLATLPVALVAFGQTSLVALPTNILLLPFIAPTMVAGLLGAIVSSLAPPLTNVCGWIVSTFTTYDISVVKLFARVPGSSLAGLSVNWIAAVIMALGMVWVVHKHYGDILEKKN